MPDIDKTSDRGSTWVIVIRIVIGATFGLAIPLALIILYHAHSSHVTVNRANIDVTNAVTSVVNPLNVVIVLLSFAAALIAETLFELVLAHRMQDTWNQQHTTALQKGWVPQDDFDECLIQVRGHYRTITAEARVEPDLFTRYYQDRIKALCRQMESSSDGDLKVNQLHFETTEILMSCLKGHHLDHDDDFWAVHYLTSESRDFFLKVPHAKSYARLLAKKVAQGEIKKVRRLFVVDDRNREVESEQLDDEFARRYIAFHKSNHPKYEYRIVGITDYEEGYIGDNQEEQLARDFGIYGSLYVYQTGVADTQAIEGTFNRDESLVGRYRSLFERCWDNDGRLYEDYSSNPLPVDVKNPEDIYAPFWVHDRPRREAAPDPSAEPIERVASDGPEGAES